MMEKQPRREPLRVLGIAGSLRRASYNRGALQAAVELAPAGMQVETFALDPIPLYNEDVREQGFPEPVAALRTRIAAADALLLVTPEYNYSIPGVLKNAIDWASRPPEQPFAGKPVAILGATAGLWGTVRSQLHLRQVCAALDMRVLPKPEVLIARAGERFDGQGRLTDPDTRKFVAGLLESLADWAGRLGAG